MEQNPKRPPSASASSGNQRSSGSGSSGGGISSTNSWCSLDSVPPPPTPFDEPSAGSDDIHVKCADEEDDEDDYVDFFTNPCVIDEVTGNQDESPSPKVNMYNSPFPRKPPDISISTISHNHHQQTPAEDEEALTPSIHQNGTPASTQISTDSCGLSEEEARLSSTPLNSSIPPEHTLSDISGPCSSSILFECGGGRGGQGENSSSVPHSILPVVLGSTSTSTSSLSDTEDDTEGHKLVGNSIHEYDVLPPPPEPEVDDAVPMTVDTCEDYWTRLHDVRINGCILEYTGIGKSLHDNGFAQSNVPLTPLNHYFEITILDPGEHCYIAIGLARKDYNMRKNPGWCSGSIAYHTDDGKIFLGGGVRDELDKSGTPFGPRCTLHDILGCGIIFPTKYAELPEGGTWPWEGVVECSSSSKQAKSPRLPGRHRRKARSYGGTDNHGAGDLFSTDEEDESEDDIWWNNAERVCEDKVKVFFMRNKKLLGIKEVRIPKGGFYPTIGMMSNNERVSVDLHPLSG